ncbi:hypothetical protein CN404_21250 [Bacillus thuringiensis]|nr:hypothetical protein CN404_21250 [Bacillus thuringiensis]
MLIKSYNQRGRYIIMKYKDRKNAKRKYKQALLATVATMTLGVSTLGSTASVFAEENTQQQQSAMAPATDGSVINIDGSGDIKTDGIVFKKESTDGLVFKRADDGTITVSKEKEKLFNINTLKAIGSLGGATFKQAWADRKAGNFNNTFRTLAMGSAALIPYGGVVISPLIGYLWPENDHEAQAKLKQLMSDIAAQTKTQIADYDVEALGSKLKKLRKDLQEFEGIMNPTGRKIAAAPSVGDEAESTRILVGNIHNDFKNLIEESQKESYKETELPIFMVAATAHLQFLNYLALHGKDPKLNYDDKGLKIAALTPLERAHKEYKEYATEAAKKGLDAINNAERPVKQMQESWTFKYLASDLKKQALSATIMGPDTVVKETFDTTINNIAFKQALGIKDDWTMDQDGRILYYDPQDHKMQTGWKEISTSFAARIQNTGNLSIQFLKDQGLKYSWYYFSPEKTDKFAKGELYKDTTETINGKTYTFGVDGTCLNPDGGEAAGWHQIGEAWYFYSDGKTKNSEGKTFAKNEKVTGWYKDEKAGRYYYLSPGETKNSDKKVFKAGEMVTGWYQEGNKWYYLTPNPRKNKEGSEFAAGQLIFGTLSIEDKNGEYVQYKFNNDGSLKE